LPRLRAETTACTKRSRPPKNLFGEQVGEGRPYGVQARRREGEAAGGTVQIEFLRPIALRVVEELK
jgi:hypothetical protein